MSLELDKRPVEVVLSREDETERVAALLQAHEQVLRAGADLIAAAARAGRILREIEAQHRREGGWRAWIEDNLPFTYATAHLYMRCAKHEDIIREQGWTRIREVKEGLGALVEPNHTGKGRTGKGKPEWMKDLAREMFKDGTCVARIAVELGVSPSSVKCWVDPAHEKVTRAKVAAINKRRVRAERALREQERAAAIKLAVRKAGAATQEAWAMAERMQDVLAQAQRETQTRQASEALSNAGVHHRRMRDDIVRALGVS